MRLVPAVLGWQDPGSAFSAAMQLAALGRGRELFLDRMSESIGGQFGPCRHARQLRDRSFQFALWIVVATVPIGIAGLALAKLLNTCNSPLRAISVIGWACIAMAILLAIAEIWARHRRTIENTTIVDAIVVGLAQTGALIPVFRARARH